MNILYFAWLRTTIGKPSETLDLPETVKTVDDVLELLRERGEPYITALDKNKVIRVALNQDYAKGEDTVNDNDEFAIFPPVTGG